MRFKESSVLLFKRIVCHKAIIYKVENFSLILTIFLYYIVYKSYIILKICIYQYSFYSTNYSLELNRQLFAMHILRCSTLISN